MWGRFWTFLFGDPEPFFDMGEQMFFGISHSLGDQQQAAWNYAAFQNQAVVMFNNALMQEIKPLPEKSLDERFTDFKIRLAEAQARRSK